jgi:hypothetical protein
MAREPDHYSDDDRAWLELPETKALIAGDFEQFRAIREAARQAADET